MAGRAVAAPRANRSAELPAHVSRMPRAAGDDVRGGTAGFERRFVRAALASADGQRARAAAGLGITRQGLTKMMRRLGIDRG